MKRVALEFILSSKYLQADMNEEVENYARNCAEHKSEKEQKETSEIAIDLKVQPQSINNRAKKGDLSSAAVHVEMIDILNTSTTSIISLSDSEDVMGEPKDSKQTAKKVVKKRKSMEGTSSNTEGGTDADHMRFKRRKIKAAGAPKMPLTGYVRYMNERREILKKEHPRKTSIEHTKMIGEEWQTLSYDRKAPYMEQAAKDKQRYLSELDVFLREHPDVLADELAKDKARKNSTDGRVRDKSCELNTGLEVKDDKDRIEEQLAVVRQSDLMNITTDRARARSVTPPISTIVAPMPGEIPIFTNEFLEHNRIFDLELRALRKSKTDLEQQNAVLEKHVENMRFGVEKMTSENDQLQEKNRLLELYLEKLKMKLAHALSGLAIPTEPNGATLDNIDKYMSDLYKMATTNSHGPASLNKAKDIIRKLDLQIQL